MDLTSSIHRGWKIRRFQKELAIWRAGHLLVGRTLSVDTNAGEARSVIYISPRALEGFPGGSDGKEAACKAGDLGSIPGLGRSPGGGHGNPLQYSCLENPMDREPGGLQSMGSKRAGYD